MPPGDSDKQLLTNVLITLEGIPGAEDGLFTAFDPPDISTNVGSHEHFATGNGETVKSHAGNPKLQFGPASFRRGIDKSNAFSDWLTELNEKGVAAAKKDLVVKVQDREKKITKTYNMKGALPQALNIPGVEAGSEAPWVESVTIVVEDFKIT